MSVTYGKTSAQILADSIDKHNQRITTFLLKFPRVILAEFNTHRAISRNVSSSRAIPFEKVLDRIANQFYIPFDIGYNEKGMQSFTPLSENEFEIYANWHENLFEIVREATTSINTLLNVHKQFINRYLEPFMFIDVVATSTDWESFIALRDHRDAHPDIQCLAKLIKNLLLNNTPKLLTSGQFHLPFIKDEEKILYLIEDLIKASVSRCARTSYQTFDGSSIEVRKDINLFYKLINSNPIHASPLEHVAKCTDLRAIRYFDNGEFVQKNYHFNLKGWKSFRFLYEIENMRI